MATSTASRAHIILEAVRYASNADIPALRQVIATRPDALKLEITLRILLTYLPLGTEPALYTDFLQDLPSLSSSPSQQLTTEISTQHRGNLSEEEARLRVRRLHLLPLVVQSIPKNEEVDPLTHFLLHQAHNIDAETGSLELVSQLLAPFVDHSEYLRTWMISNLLPLLRLDYEYYPHSGSSHTLQEFENLDGTLAVQSLLSKAIQPSDPGDTQKIGRDLRELVGPWMYGEGSRKRRKLNQRARRKSSVTTTIAPGRVTEDAKSDSDWSCVNDWLLDLSIRDFQRTVDAVVQWDGPKDVDYGDWGSRSRSLDEESLRTATKRYAQAALAALYATNSASLETIIGSHRALLQVARLTDHDEPPDLKRTDTSVVSGISREYMKGLSHAHLLHNALLSPQNPFSLPSDNSISLFNLILASSYKLLNLGNIKTSRAVAELALFGSEADQMAELRKTLHKLKQEKMDAVIWASIRRQVLWLCDWEQDHDSGAPRGVFSKIGIADVENELLRSILDGGCYSVAADIYCKATDAPLPSVTLESTVLNAVYSAYDAASNGNRARGGVRKASDIISTFHDYFPNSTHFKETSALLSATHSMSFYSLTLQHGVPFRPVNIRAHKDPINLIGKILSQNADSYTHLDDMLEIGQNLVAAGLLRQDQGTPSDSNVDLEKESVITSRRITRMAIEAALEEDDFDTAYSYVVNRLSMKDRPKSIASEQPAQLFPEQDDISWRAAYQAGRFAINDSGASTLRRLEQRMELLSQALLLAPPSALCEVLTTWQKCEQEMAVLTAKEAAEDEKWDEKGNWNVPGGYAADSSPVIQRARDPTRSALDEEAPMGLFEVARGAAAALSKSTFPLRHTPREGPQSPSKSSHTRPLSTVSVDSSDEGSISAGGQPRVRKRDMVSSMVTGGLATGIGWVIGKLIGSMLVRFY